LETLSKAAFSDLTPPHAARPSKGPIDATHFLKQDSTRVNRVFRQVLEPITMTPVEEKGRRFYRATGAAKGPEMLNRLGLAQAVDFGGCGGWICRILHASACFLD
jgi:hypothetical protein